jgi:hypothetical protein
VTPLVAAAIVLTIVYAARTLSFRILLAGYGIRVTWRQASVVAWIPQIGKFIPGHVASVAGAVVILRSFGVPGAVALSATLIMDGLAVISGLITGSPLLLTEQVRRVLPNGWFWCAVVVIGGVVCLHPRIYGRLLHAILIKLKRAPLTAVPPWHHYLAPVMLGFAQWVLAGVALWLTARSVTGVEPRQIPLFVAICGIGYTAGYLAPFTASGLGVREPIFQFTLTPLIGAHAAVVVIASRVIQTLVEIAMALAGTLVLRQISRDISCTPVPINQTANHI